MARSSYDVKTDTYTVEITREELMEALKSRRAYRDFLLENFGFHLTENDSLEVKL